MFLNPKLTFKKKKRVQNAPTKMHQKIFDRDRDSAGF